MTGKCIIFSAPSGAGKTTIVKELLKKKELKLEFSVSATTRLPRETELHAKDYYFLTLTDFKNKIETNAFVEWEEVYKDSFYGTLKTEIDRIWQKGNSVVFDVDVKGALSIKREYPEACLIFICPPSIGALRERLEGRKTEDKETVAKRLQRVEMEMNLRKHFDHQVVNDVLQTAIDEVQGIIKKHLLN